MHTVILPDAVTLKCKLVPTKKYKQWTWDPMKPNDFPLKTNDFPPPPPEIMVKFTYEERFTEAQANTQGLTLKQLLENTYSVVGPMLKPMGVSLKKGKDKLVVTGTVSRQQLGNMMMSEFMSWGTLGHMSIMDLMVHASLRGATVPHIPTIPAPSGFTYARPVGKRGRK